MHRSTRVVAPLALALALIAVPAAAAPLGRKVTSHRVRAGKPDPSGWCQARSTKGGFAIALPGKFDDFTVSGKGQDGVVQHAYNLVATTDEVKVVAMALEKADGRVPPDALRKFAEGLGGEQHPVQHAGLEGVEARTAEGGGVALHRFLVGKHRSFAVTVIVRASVPEKLEPVAHRVFDSLKIERD